MLAVPGGRDRQGHTPIGVSHVPTGTRQGVVDQNRIYGPTTALLPLEAPCRPDGRFGVGNPGRPRGSKNKATQAALALLEGEAEALTRKAVDLALAGDTTALRLCMERLLSPRRDVPVVIDLPPLHSARDAAEAVGVVVAAVGRGELTPLEGAAVVGLIDSYRRTLEVTELKERVAELKEAVRGPA